MPANEEFGSQVIIIRHASYFSRVKFIQYWYALVSKHKQEQRPVELKI